jgi:surface antigen
MKHLSRFSVWIALSLMIYGCTSTPDEETPLWVYSSTGAAIGGMAGGYIGSGLGATIASVGGAAAGGLLGYKAGLEIQGTPLKETSERALLVALKKPSSDPVTWESNNQEGTNLIKGSVTAGAVFLNGSGQKCRRLTQILHRKTQRKQENFIACQTPPNDWDITRI